MNLVAPPSRTATPNHVTLRDDLTTAASMRVATTVQVTPVGGLPSRVDTVQTFGSPPVTAIDQTMGFVTRAITTLRDMVARLMQ